MLELCQVFAQACFRRFGVGPECHPLMPGVRGTATMRMATAEVAGAGAETEAMTGGTAAAAAAAAVAASAEQGVADLGAGAVVDGSFARTTREVNVIAATPAASHMTSGLPSPRGLNLDHHLVWEALALWTGLALGVHWPHMTASAGRCVVTSNVATVVGVSGAGTLTVMLVLGHHPQGP